MTFIILQLKLAFTLGTDIRPPHTNIASLKRKYSVRRNRLTQSKINPCKFLKVLFSFRKQWHKIILMQCNPPSVISEVIEVMLLSKCDSYFPENSPCSLQSFNYLGA